MIQPRLALRSLLKTPLVTTAAVLSLALGIGANAAIFSLFEQMVLRPLPVEDPESLVNLVSDGPKPGSQSSSTSGGHEAIFSHPMYRDLQEAQTSFTGIAGHRNFGANLAFGGHTESVEGLLVSGNYFQVLGLEPAHGRLFTPEDDRTPGAHPLVVLSHAYFEQRFAADLSVLGETLVMNGQPMTVLGVAPEGFRGTTLGNDPKIFLPLNMQAEAMPGREILDNRRNYWVYCFARLLPGVTSEQAQESLNGPYSAILSDVEVPLQEGLSERTLAQFAAKTIELEPGLQGQSRVHEMTSAPLLLLLGVTGLVLLIACANIANLLLVRALGRSGEIALRLSLGAQRHQIVNQLLCESMMLATAGGLLAIAVAHGALRLLVTALGTDIPLAFELNGSLALFLVVVSLLTGLAGLFPALYTTGGDLASRLKNQGGSTSASRTTKRFQKAMATFQVALSMALLVAAGLFTKSLLNVSRVDLGMDTEQLATFGLSPERNAYENAASRQLFEQVEQEIQALPGVRSVVASVVPLVSDSNWGSNVSVEGFEAGPDTDTHSNYNEIGPGYFRTLGIHLLAGREFEERDDENAPNVAVVNETFARKFNLGRDAVGKRMQVGSGGENDIEIVGLAPDTKYSAVKDEVPPLFFLPYRQNERIGVINFYVRAEGTPTSLLPAVRQAVARIDPNLPVERLATMPMVVRENIILDRMLSGLSAAFALLATLLAAIGLYGVLAWSVAQRKREIGLRMALGADPGRVRNLVFRQMVSMIAIGATLGLVAAFGLGRVAGSLLYDLEGHDPGVLAGSAVLLTIVALTASMLPAARAARVDPLRALREE